MFEELSDKLGALLACGNTGVLVALAKACLRLKAKQAQYINVSYQVTGIFVRRIYNRACD